jgi:hypothetical protein
MHMLANVQALHMIQTLGRSSQVVQNVHYTYNESHKKFQDSAFSGYSAVHSK